MERRLLEDDTGTRRSAFLFLTKRIVRFMDCVPADWGEGYGNVTVGCTVENQRAADERLPVFRELPIRHKISLSTDDRPNTARAVS